jgi:hypothetical protein
MRGARFGPGGKAYRALSACTSRSLTPEWVRDFIGVSLADASSQEKSYKTRFLPVKY